MHRMCSSIFRFDKNGAERCMFCDSFINILGSDIIHNLPLCDFWKQMRDAGLCYSRKDYTNMIYAYSTFRNNVIKFLTGYDTWRDYQFYEVILKDKSKSKKVERSASCKLRLALYHTLWPRPAQLLRQTRHSRMYGADPTEPERVDDRKENE